MLGVHCVWQAHTANLLSLFCTLDVFLSFAPDFKSCFPFGIIKWLSWTNIIGITKTGIANAPLSFESHLFFCTWWHQSKEHCVKIKQGQEIGEAKNEVFWCTYWHELTRAYEGYQLERGMQNRAGCSLSVFCPLDMSKMNSSRLSSNEQKKKMTCLNCILLYRDLVPVMRRVHYQHWWSVNGCLGGV